MPQRPYPRWQRRHEDVLLWCLKNPRMNQRECAEATGYSTSQVSRIMCSPGFHYWYGFVGDLLKEEHRLARLRRHAANKVAGQYLLETTASTPSPRDATCK